MKIKSVYGKECKEIKWNKKFKAGYILQKELITSGGSDCWMTVAYNHNGDYIGNSKDAYRLCVKRGILPELGSGSVCSIGKSQKNSKWYGWSHRAIFGFKIGDKVKKGDCCASSGWIEGCEEYKNDPNVLPVGFKAKTEKDCKKMAIAFASSVS